LHRLIATVNRRRHGFRLSTAAVTYRNCSHYEKKSSGNKTVVVGMSGGVDSTITAAMLKSQGYDVVGVFMRNWDEVEESGECKSVAEYRQVQQICDQLGIRCTMVDFVKEYWNDVFSSFLEMYEQGLTPNPDVLCNRFIKFGAFLNYVEKDLGIQQIATGHYARLQANTHYTNGEQDVRLLRGVDINKDQSYFLAGLPSAALSKTLFPIGEMHKNDVKSLARTLN